MQKSTARWVPAVAVPLILVAGAIVIPATANASVVLPAKTVEEVLQLALDSAGTSFSGTVEQTSDLGIPEIPATAAGTSMTDALEFLSGSHTASVFQSGSESSRVQIIEDLAERDVYRTGQDVWTWDSEKNEAVHSVLPSHDDSAAPEGLPATPVPSTPVPSTPGELISTVLEEAGESTDITLTDNVRVAGRAAYGIVLTPRTADTLVGDVTIAVDAETGVPLSAAITAAGQENPALSVAFTAIDFAEPPADIFAFTPPADADVTEADLAGKVPAASDRQAPSGLTVIGDGWSRVVGIPLPADSQSSGSELDQFLTPVDGGRVLETSLVSVFLTDDGRLFAGAVSAAKLQAAAAE